jgi:ATP-binding cassette, subfamily C, bacterial LapB
MEATHKPHQPMPAAAEMLDAAVFLAQFLGTTVHLEPMKAAAQSLVSFDDLTPLMSQAGLVATALPAGTRSASELPAILLDAAGRPMVVLELKDGRYECHTPGIQGSRWFNAQSLDQTPGARWLAVRPQIHFDQRSLLYSLARPGSWFWDVFNRNRWMFGWALLGTLALNVIGAVTPFYTMAVYDRVLPNDAVNSLWVLTVGVAVLMVFELAMRFARSNLLETAARRMDVTLSTHIFQKCLSMRAASRPASGGVLANTVRDFESIRDFFTSGTLTLLGDLPFVLLFIAVIALIGGWLVVVPIVAVVLIVSVAWMARPALAASVRQSTKESSQRTAHLFETMNGLDTVKTIGAEAWSRRRWESLSQSISQNSMETRELMARVNYTNTTITAVAGVAVVAVGALMASAQGMTVGQIIACTMLCARAVAPANQIAALIIRWQQTKLSFEALDHIMKAPSDDSAATLQAPPLMGAVEFRDVSFAYPRTPPIIERLNLRIKPGEKVGVIGKLGSGKSTVLRLILNQYEPSSGSVLVDNLVTTQIEPLSLRRQIGYVPQDVTLFHGTVRENIELGRSQADDSALVAAIRASCLEDTVAQLPSGVATEVGERGERLSGGQRQTVAIARALLSRPKLLLLDEPSSMIDPATEMKLIQQLRALNDTTVILVTHRMAMLNAVNRLIVFDRGRVVADGPRDEVLLSLAQRATNDSVALAKPKVVLTEQFAKGRAA